MKMKIPLMMDSVRANLHPNVEYDYPKQTLTVASSMM